MYLPLRYDFGIDINRSRMWELEGGEKSAGLITIEHIAKAIKHLRSELPNQVNSDLAGKAYELSFMVWKSKT